MMATDVIVSGGDDVEVSDCSPSPPPSSLVSAKNGQLTNMAQQGVSNGSNLSTSTGDGGSDANDTNSNNISSSCDSGDIVEVNRDDDQVNGASPGGHSLARPPSLEPLATAGASVPVSVCAASAAADSDTEPSAKRLCVDSAVAGAGEGAGTVSATAAPPAVGAATATDVSGQRAFELIESSLLKLKREVRALDLLVRQKEREWDCLIKLRKTKEETFQRLRRKRKVLLLQASDTTLSGASVSTGATAAMTPLVAAAVSDAGGSLRRLAPANQRKVPSLPSLSVAGVAALTAACGGATTSLPFSLPSYTQSMALRKPIASHQPASLPPPPPSSALAASLQPPSSMVAAAAAAAAASANDARFRDALAQIIKMNKPTPELSVHQLPRPAVDQLQQQPPPHQAVTASSAAQQLSAAAAAAAAAAVVSNQHHQQQSSLAKLLIESKRKQSDAVLSEILKHPQMSLVTPMARASAAISPLSQPTRATPPVPPPPPPPAPSESVPLCQGCRLRQAQFVCAGCGNQWYCSRDCQVASWDSHADECTG